jgi:multicomponent Na+:H+ antiporter subunit E
MRLLLGRGVWLVAVWAFLWEDLSPGSLVGGALVAAAVLAAYPPRAAVRKGRFRLLPAIRFLAYFAWKLVQASFVVAWEIVTPRNRINEAVVAVPVRHFSHALTTLVANAISLTPGTLTIEVNQESTMLYVHVLHFRTVDQVRREVRTLETMAIKAFGDPTALASTGAGTAGQLSEGTSPEEGPK